MVAIGESTGFRAGVTSALGERADLRFVKDAPRDLRGAARELPHAVVIAVGLESEGGLSATVERARSLYPFASVLLYCASLTAETFRMLVECPQAAAATVVAPPYDDLAAALARAIERREDEAIAATVMHQLSDQVPPSVRPIVAYCVLNARTRPLAQQVARVLGVDVKTVRNRLRAAGLPATATMISWSRLFVAACLVGDRQLPVEYVALALHFASGSALRGMLKRYTGLTPTDVRREGGLRVLVRCFARVHPSARRSASAADVTRADFSRPARTPGGALADQLSPPASGWSDESSLPDRVMAVPDPVTAILRTTA